MSPIFRVLLSLPFWRRLLIGLGLAYLGIVLTLGGSREAKPLFAGLAICWVLFLGMHHYELLIIRPVAARPRCRCAQRNAQTFLHLERFGTVMMIILFGAEACLRAYGAYSGSSLVVGNKLDAYRLLPGHDYGGGLRGNQLGYPGPDFQRGKRPGVFRIAALGNSFAIGYAVPFADNYLTLLGKKLPRTEVYNFGVSGAGPREYQEILQRDVWNYHPDLVLVTVFVGNNITEMMPKPRHMDPRQHSLYVLLERGWRLAKENLRQIPTESIQDEERWPPPGLSPEVFRSVEARRLEVCTHPPSASMEKKWRRTFADLDRLVMDCRRRHVPLAMVVIPDEFQVNPAVLGEALAAANLRPNDLDLTLPQRRLTVYCARRNVPCLDLLPVFREVPQTYALCDTHWNVRGHRLAATVIAQWLEILVPTPSVGTRRGVVTPSASAPPRPIP